MPGHRQAALTQEVLNLRRSLKALDRSLRRLAPMLASGGGDGRGQKKAPTRGARRLSPKARASLVLQGRYMGFMRQLEPRQKAQVRQIREAKGVRVAIKRARRLAR